MVSTQMVCWCISLSTEMPDKSRMLMPLLYDTQLKVTKPRFLGTTPSSYQMRSEH